MGFLSSGEPETTDRVGDSPSFAVAGFLGGDTGGSGDNSGGDSGGDSGGFDPAIHVGPDKRNADGTYRKKRGRKPGNSSGSGNRKKADYSASVDSLAGVLMVLHAGISAATKTPELSIEQDDAQTLAKAAANVLIEFDITPDPKIAAIVGLVIAAGSVYGPIGVSIKLRRDQERKERLRQQPTY